MNFFTVAEIAKMLKLSESQVYALIDDGLLKCHRFTRGRSGAIRVSQSQLDAYLASTLEQEPPAPEPAPSLPEPRPRKKAAGGGIDLW
jgi:excisionase family DNA binding protein